ncbi:MAG: hypothetical protein IJF21_05730 [Clostridia bacterium]|nr:hypothetical protein [Clostridia bacterium]
MSEQTPDLGAMVSKLLGNPELISQIASTVGIEAPQGEEKKEDGAAAPASAPALDAVLPMLASAGVGSSKRTALLSALKPFCNEHRCRTIDYMIGISKLSEALIPTKRG